MRRETSISIPVDHPAFAGHFPGTPIVPGVVLLDEALFAIQATTGASPQACHIALAKFFHPVGPGARLVIRHKPLADGSVRFDILDGPRTVASGVVLMSPAGAGAPG